MTAILGVIHVKSIPNSSPCPVNPFLGLAHPKALFIALVHEPLAYPTSWVTPLLFACWRAPVTSLLSAFSPGSHPLLLLVWLWQCDLAQHVGQTADFLSFPSGSFPALQHILAPSCQYAFSCLNLTLTTVFSITLNRNHWSQRPPSS